jgi:hypothetical protein
MERYLFASAAIITHTLFDRNGFLVSSAGCDSIYGFEYKIFFYACGAGVAYCASD